MGFTHIVFGISAYENNMQLYLLELLLQEKGAKVQNLGIVENSDIVFEKVKNSKTSSIYAITPIIYDKSDASIALVEDILIPLSKEARVFCLLASRTEEFETQDIITRLKLAGLENVVSVDDTLQPHAAILATV